MKISKYLSLGFLVISLMPVWGQLGQNYNTTFTIGNSQPSLEATNLTKFNLDFPGGTPAQLVKAIEKAMGKPLNAIIADEDADTKLPPLKMSNVDVPQLFNALVNMSYKYEGNTFNQMRNVVSSFGFASKDSQLSDDSIWYFFVYKAQTPQPSPPPAKICQFYSLQPYLNRGFTVDDITTAIQTGWKMAGITSPPELNYHKETQLLIAFGEPDELRTIQTVLYTLPQLESTYWQDMNKNIFALQQQVKELQAKVSATATNAAPEEKSGK
jgi:hypothetical protein